MDRVISRLRWHLHELDPAWPAPTNFDRASAFARIKFHLDDFSRIVADLAQRLLTHLHRLIEEIDELTAELGRRIPVIAPALRAIVGCGSLTEAKILGETACVTRFRSKGAYARHNGTAPLPVWSSNRARHRLSRTGNRQLNAALHRIALTQARCHPGARASGPPQSRRRRRHGGTAYPQTPTIRRRIPSSDRRSQNLRSQHAHPGCLIEELETVPRLQILCPAESS
jgi:transposase